MRASRAFALCFTIACANIIGIDDPQVAPQPRPDAAVCASSVCDFAPQCGCSTGLACDLNSTDTGHVCRAAGSGIETTPCTSDTECAVGYTCAFRNGSGQCQKWCSMDSDCDGPRARCIDQLSSGSGSNGTLIPGAFICTSACDPLSTTNSQCPSGWSCDYHIVNYMGSDQDSVECRAPGTVNAGASCASGICKAGLTCVAFSNGTQLCEHPCSPNMNTSCPTGTCHSFTTKFTVAGVEYGACW